MKSPNKLQYALLAVILIISLSSLVLAASLLDKNYNPATETVTLSYSGTDLGTLKLDYNTGFCIGKDACKGRLEVIPFFDINTKTIGKFDKKFVDTGNIEQLISNDWKWFYWVEEQYPVEIQDWKTCNKLDWTDLNDSKNPVEHYIDYRCKDGTHIEYKTRQTKEYKEIGEDTLFAGQTYYVEIIGSLYEGAIDWQITFGDLLIDEFAWWNSSVTHKSLGYINQTTTSAFRNFTYYVNRGNGGICGNEQVLTKAIGFPSGATNGTFYLYNNSCTDFYIVNGSENTQIPVAVIEGAGTNYSSTDVFDVNTTGFFPFGEGSGTTTNDWTSNANNGSFEGTPTWVKGIAGNALSFDGDGSNDCVNLGDDASLRMPGGTAFSLEAWVWFDGVATTNTFISSTGVGKDVYNFRFYSAGFYFCVDTGTSTCLTSTSAHGIGRWMHAVATWDGSNRVIYVNGTADGTDEKTGNLVDEGSLVMVGCINSGAQETDGIVDEVVIYDRALSADEVKARYEMMRLNYSTLGAEETDVVPSGDVFVNVNWTALPYYSNSTRNISFMPVGNTSSYNVTYGELNNTVAYGSTYTINDWPNNTLYSNQTDSIQHEGEVWALTVNATPTDASGHNSTNVTIGSTAPDKPTDIPPTPANDSTIGTLTPTINISANDIDGNGSLNCNFFMGSTLDAVIYQATLQTNSDGYCNWTTSTLAQGIHYWNATVGDSTTNSSVTGLKSFTVTVAAVNVNLNFTDLPYYSNSTLNISFNIQGNTTTYNATYNISNGSVQYLLHTVNIANNTLFSNKSVDVAAAGETWNVIVNTTALTTIGYNTTATTILDTRPDQPLNIPPTPTNNTEISDLTPVINISVNDIDGNSSLNCHFYFGTTVTPAYNFTMQTNNGICNWTTPTLGDGFTYYHKTQVGDSELNSTFTPLETFTIGIGNVFLNVNVTDTPVYTNTTMSVTISALGNTSAYNITLEVLNGTASYLTYTFNLANNTAWINDTTIAPHAGEIWNMSVNASGAANSTTVLISYTTPENITDIAPTPANDTWTNDNTPTINISATSIDGNTSLNCHLYFGTGVVPDYNQTIQTNAAGNCNFTILGVLPENTYQYWDVAVGNGHTNSSRTATERFRVDTVAPSYADISPQNYSYISDSTPTLMINLTDTGSGIDNASLETFNFNSIGWTNITISMLHINITNGIQATVTIGSQPNGRQAAFNTSIRDNAGNQIKVKSWYNIDTASPSSVTLISPANAATSAVASTIFTANATDALSNLSNATLRIWKAGAIHYEESKIIDVFDASNKSNTTSITYTLTDVGDYVWNYYFCDNATQQGLGPNCVYGANRTYTYYSLALNLEAPVNNTNTTDSTPDFIFNYTRNPAATGICSLYVNETLISTDTSVTSGVNTTITSTALNDGLQQTWHINCTDGTNTVTSDNRSIGIDATAPVLTILLPIDEYFTQGLPYENIPLNFSYIESNPDSCWYIINHESPYFLTNATSASNDSDSNFFINNKPQNAWDGNWTTYAKVSIDDSGNIYQNFTIEVEYADGIYWKGKYQGGGGAYNNLTYWNYTLSDWQSIDKIISGVVVNRTYKIPPDYYGDDGNLRIRHTLVGLGAETANYFEGVVIINGTTISSCSNTTFNISSSGNHTVYLYMNDTFGNIGSATSSFSINLYNVSHKVSSGNVTEGESVTFSMQINSTNITSTNATLYYNGTAYGYGALVNTTLQANFTRTLSIPSGIGPIPYYWNYSINAFSNLTDARNITVSSLSLLFNATCPGTLSTAYNITLKDELNFSVLTGRIRYNFKYGIDNNTQYTTFGELTSTSTFSICMNTSIHENYTIGYGELDYNVDGYAERNYYIFEDAVISNETITLDIFNLETGKATSFQFLARNYLLTPYDDIYLGLLRWYPENDTYRIVEMAHTNDDGKTVMRVQVEDTDYRIALYELDGTLIHLTSPTKIACLETPCTFTITVTGTESDYTSIYGVASAITYSTTTKMFTYTWNDPSLLTTSMTFYVFKDTGYTYTDICNKTGLGNTGVLDCNVSDYDGMIVARGYRTASPMRVIAEKIVEIRDIINRQLGLFIQLIVSMFMGFIAIWNPVVAIIFAIISFLVGAALGVISFQIFVAVAVIGGIVIHFIGRSGK